ncbi:MAG TPA: peptide deformylase [Luteibaculaceae bacterium]|nr:peptide deformylase [Luteibaculaceae bacterium]
MIYPIVAYGTPVLRKKAVDISPEDPELKALIADMFETMYQAHGVGLAAPQINKSIRLFVVDCSPFAEDDEDDDEETNGQVDKSLADFKKVFINAQMLEETGEEWGFTEGCLSIPDIREEVKRKPTITIRYFDEHFVEHTDTFSGFAARVIQHEYDHIEGVLFTDKINPMKRSLLSGKLNEISKGRVDVRYKMKFPQAKRR